ncbi:hypothetical protein GCM10010521_57980 [Streptomyces rameus]|uniref:Uncharacterized protein n=1 Tax=Streptomyces rameus TaxID=68261 RepID=A0ABP6HFI0_9ACTN
MPEETTPPAAPPATPPAGPALGGPVVRALGAGCLGCGGLVLVAVLALVGVLLWNASDGTDLPRVAPREMADRAVRNSQEAYDVMGFTRALQPGEEPGEGGAGTRNTLGAQYCYDGGPLGLEDRTVDGAYGMYHEWALDQVPAGRAVPGLRRLRRRLREDGWDVSSYREGGSGEDWSLFVRRDGGERMSFTWSPRRRYFTGGATVPCAYDPGWTAGAGGFWSPDSAAGSVTPPVLAPGRL